MNKYVINICLIMLFLLLPISASAIQTPLEAPRTRASVLENNDLHLVSYTAYLLIGEERTTIQTSMVIRNNHLETDANFLMGLPTQVDSGQRRIRDLIVTMDGQTQRLTNRADATLPEASTLRELPAQWQTWTVRLQPGENKVVDTSFHIDHIIDANGTESILLPLDFLKPWQGPIRSIQITADMGLHAAYVIDPNPSITPASYDGSGRLTWQFTNVNTPQDIKIYYRPIDKIVAAYIKEHAPQDSEIDHLLNEYRIKHYDGVIVGIDGYLASHPETPLSQELLFLQALSHQNLYQHTQAIALLNQLEENPGFGPVSSTVQNKIVHDKYQYLKTNTPEESYEAYTYLENIRSRVSGNALFDNWLQDEFNSLTPPPLPEPELPEPPPETNEPAPDQEERLVTDVVIAGITIPVEFIFLGVAVFIILLLLLTLRKRNKRTRGYLFR